MKKLATVIAAIALIGTPAFAADMAVKAPPPAPAAAPDLWTGFYVGGSIGARWSDAGWQTLSFGTVPPTTVDNPAHLDSTSARVGGYLGYNFRFAPIWLAGLEADIAWGNNNQTHTPFPGGSGFKSAPGSDFVTTKLGWDGSFRGRIGVLANPSWLIYATGGVAWQELKTISTCLTTFGYCGLGVPFTGTTSSVQTGWTIGGGLETVLATNWFARIEYRYADFGHVTNILPPAPNTGMTSRVGVTTNTAIVGLAYKW